MVCIINNLMQVYSISIDEFIREPFKFSPGVAKQLEVLAKQRAVQTPGMSNKMLMMISCGEYHHIYKASLIKVLQNLPAKSVL